MTEPVAQRCSVKKVFLEILQNSQENICARVSFLIMLHVFLWILRNFKNTFFLQNASSDCFYNDISVKTVRKMLITISKFPSFLKVGNLTRILKR